MSAIVAMYKEAWTVARTKEGDSKRYEVKMGLNQGTVESVAVHYCEGGGNQM